MELERLFRELIDAIRSSDPSQLHQPHRLRDIQYRLVPYRAVRHSLGVDCSEDHEMLLLRLCAGEGDYFTVSDRDARRAFGEEAAGINPDLGLLQVYGDIEVRLQEQAINRSTKDAAQESAYRPPETAPGPVVESAPVEGSIEAEEEEEEAQESAYRPPETAPAPAEEAAAVEGSIEAEEEEEEETMVIPLPRPAPAPPDVPAPPPIPEPTHLDVPPPDTESEPEPDLGPRPEPEPYLAASSPSFALADEEPATEPETREPQCAYCGGSLPPDRQANFCPHCGQNLNVIKCGQCDAELEYGWRHCITCGHPVPED